MNIKNFIKFCKTVGILKLIKRTGWIKNNIPNPESVAEHSYRLAMMAMILAPKVGADQLKSIKMSLVHDIGEAKIGDIITSGPNQMMEVNAKVEKERAAFIEIFKLIRTEDFLELFDEFEEDQTKEAQLVKQLDKLEMAIQALEYENYHKLNLEGFFEHTREVVMDDFIKQILENIEKLRKIK